MTTARAEILTERLLLRPVDETDAAEVLDLYSRPEVARWSGDGTAMASLDQARARIERYGERGGGRPGQGAFAVVPRSEPGRGLVGIVMLVPLPASRGVDRDDVEIGWHLHPDVWGHGYATEGGAAMARRGWQLGLDEVYAVTRPDNVASQAVCRRLAMSDLGLRTDWYDTTSRAFVLAPSESGHDAR